MSRKFLSVDIPNGRQIFKPHPHTLQDVQRYCISCYGRSLQAGQRDWQTEVWRRLCDAAREMASSTLLHDLVEGEARTQQESRLTDSLSLFLFSFQSLIPLLHLRMTFGMTSLAPTGQRLFFTVKNCFHIRISTYSKNLTPHPPLKKNCLAFSQTPSSSLPLLPVLPEFSGDTGREVVWME